MIAVSSSGRSFQALAWYLANGRTGGEQDRVAWSACRNLPTADPELAGTIMRATAAQSDRVVKPVYHVALSFDPHDPVERATMERVADRILARLGLAEHQTVIVAHRDREHPHLHLLVNRVHPETGKAWERWKDRPLIQEVLRDEERSLGLREVAGTLAPRGEEKVQGSLFEGMPSDRDSPAAQVAERAANGSKSSARQSRVAELVEAIKTLERAGELAGRRLAAELEASASRTRLAEIEAAKARASGAEAALMKSLAAVYQEPKAARRMFEALAKSRGVDDAARTMRSDPERFGELLTSERPRRFALLPSRKDSQARTAASTAAAKARAAFEAERAVQAITPKAAEAVHDAGSVAPERRAFQDELRRAPRRDELEHRITALMERLLPWELVRLKSLLTAPQFALAQSIHAAAREVALGHDGR